MRLLSYIQKHIMLEFLNIDKKYGIRQSSRQTGLQRILFSTKAMELL